MANPAYPGPSADHIGTAQPAANGRSGGAVSKYFSDFAHLVARLSGTPAAFLIAVATVLIWR